MNKLFLINDEYYVLAFDYYDAITIFKDWKHNYDEDIVRKIEIFSENIIYKQAKIKKDEEKIEENEDE